MIVPSGHQEGGDGTGDKGRLLMKEPEINPENDQKLTVKARAQTQR